MAGGNELSSVSTAGPSWNLIFLKLPVPMKRRTSLSYIFRSVSLGFATFMAFKQRQARLATTCHVPGPSNLVPFWVCCSFCPDIWYRAQKLELRWKSRQALSSKPKLLRTVAVPLYLSWNRASPMPAPGCGAMDCQPGLGLIEPNTTPTHTPHTQNRAQIRSG